MNKDVLQKAEAELADIEQKLADLAPLQQRREQLRTWIMLTRQVYPDLAPAAGSAANTPVPAAPATYLSANEVGQRLRRIETQKDRVTAASIEILKAEGPMLSRQLAERLKARGIEVGGSDTASAVSSILSRNNMFKSDRAAGGWVLVQPHKEAPPPGAPTPAGA